MAYLLYDYGSSGVFTYVRVMEIFALVMMMPAIFTEALGKLPLPYSKFAAPSAGKIRMFSSRVGMYICYSPSALVALVFLAYKLNSKEGASTRLILVSSALFVHFLKRVLEVRFVHRYSGEMGAGASFLINCGYLVNVVNLLLAQNASEELAPPSVDLTGIGLAIFLIGIVGNFYHHYLLRCLRKDGSKKYQVPRGGLFSVFVSPHYQFEILTFAGIACISQTVLGACTVVTVTIYLVSRSYATKQWYLQKVEDFPKNRYCLIPFVF